MSASSLTIALPEIRVYIMYAIMQRPINANFTPVGISQHTNIVVNIKIKISSFCLR
jgi:hypothetical protein